MKRPWIETAQRVWPGEWGLINFRNQPGCDELWRRLSTDEIASIMISVSHDGGQYHTTFHVNAVRQAFATHSDLEAALIAARDRVHALGHALLMAEPVTP